MIDDIHINKASIIRRCLDRIHEEYQNDSSRLQDFTVQDSIILNLLRACEAAIDTGMHLVAARRLGVPQSSRDAFALLQTAGILNPSTAEAMKRMVGFPNIAVHNYQDIELPVLSSILNSHLPDFDKFLEETSSAALPT